MGWCGVFGSIVLICCLCPGAKLREGDRELKSGVRADGAGAGETIRGRHLATDGEGTDSMTTVTAIPNPTTAINL